MCVCVGFLANRLGCRLYAVSSTGTNPLISHEATTRKYLYDTCKMINVFIMWLFFLFLLTSIYPSIIRLSVQGHRYYYHFIIKCCNYVEQLFIMGLGIKLSVWIGAYDLQIKSFCIQQTLFILISVRITCEVGEVPLVWNDKKHYVEHVLLFCMCKNDSFREEFGVQNWLYPCFLLTDKGCHCLG